MTLCARTVSSVATTVAPANEQKFIVGSHKKVVDATTLEDIV
jgi:hypothetical protein